MKDKDMRTIMLEPVGSQCNLSCKYCYQEPVRKKSHKISVMPRKILEKVTKESLALDNGIRFLWHGGEPLLAGKDFFKDAWDIQQFYKKPNQLIENRIQTNATLIDEDWARFFAKHNFKIGTSIDGPAKLHNLSRGNSYQRVVKGITILHSHNIAVGVIITVTPFDVDYPEVIWEELIKSKNLSKSWEINICQSTEISQLVPKDEKVVKFLGRIFDLWLENNDSTIRIKTFLAILRGLLGGNTKDCAFERSRCDRFSAIDENGDVYICNRFLKRKAGYLGNIKARGLKDILSGKRANNLFYKSSILRKECYTCEWLSICGGGCVFQRWLNSGLFNGYLPECDIRKNLFSYIRKKVNQLKEN